MLRSDSCRVASGTTALLLSVMAISPCCLRGKWLRQNVPGASDFADGLGQTAGVTGQTEAARWPGYVAAFAFVLIWANWVVSTRLGVTTRLTPSDLGFLRFVVPAAVLLPVL